QMFQLPHAKFFLPHAPEQSVTPNGGPRMPSWYDIKLLDQIASNEDEVGMNASMIKINKLMKSEIKSGISAGRIILGGFLDGKRLNGLAMFLRWKSTVVAHILHDFYYAYSLVKAPHIFTKRRLMVSNQWYHFDPGEDELSGKISFCNDPHPVAGHLSHITQYHQQPAEGVDTNVQAASDHLPFGD
ncbi:hypothetical protein H4S07_001195, partial [Coemansia furcata]